MDITLGPGLSPVEQSITIYHEVIEQVMLQAKPIPPFMLDLGEAEVEILAQLAQEQYGMISVENLISLLHLIGY